MNLCPALLVLPLSAGLLLAGPADSGAPPPLSSPSRAAPPIRREAVAEEPERESEWSWPSGAPARVSRPFDPPARPWLAGHRGVDLDLPVGAVIRSPAAGTVLVARPIAGRPVVSIGHGRIRSTFEPVEALVPEGARVRRGEPIGILREGHEPSGLHWGAKLSAEEYVDPLRLLLGGVRLKPWEG